MLAIWMMAATGGCIGFMLSTMENLSFIGWRITPLSQRIIAAYKEKRKDKINSLLKKHQDEIDELNKELEELAAL